MRVTAIAAAAAAMILAGCGSSGEETPVKEAAASLKPGEYQLAWSDIEMKAIDPKEKALAPIDAAAAFPAKACVSSRGGIDPPVFAETGDECKSVNSYTRNGLVNIQLTCTREGKGKLASMIDGKFAAESFDAKVQTSTSFSGEGNYTMSRSVSGKRIGDCPAAPPGTEAP